MSGFDRKKACLILQAVLCVWVAVLLSAAAVRIYREGSARKAEHPLESVYTPENAAEALGRVLIHDLVTFEMAAMADETPLDREDRQRVLENAVAAARRREDLSETVARLCGYLQEEGKLCLEGFLRFRMPETLLFWRLCVEEAFSELLLQKEYGEAASLLRLLLNERPPRCPSLRLCLHGDGLCSLSDEGSLRMEYVDESGEGILSLLIGMAPARLIVYDLSNGARQELVKALTEIFSGRVCLYTGDFP